ncbi:MAG TPA: hypothetical protein VMM27_04055 [Casimicrobiaceae bacterium]|nr:hypothetical protein [Casimicrobiaceae bacterium]
MLARLAIRASLLAVLIVGIAGCIESKYPVSPAEGAAPDPALYGLWRSNDKGEVVYVHVGPKFPPGATPGTPARTMVIVIDHNMSGISDDAYLGHPSRIGAQRYLNLEQIRDGKPAGFVFVKYALSENNNALNFWTMSEEAVKRAIGAGQIEGTISGTAPVADLVITSNSDAIEKFLREHGADVFVDRKTLRRVKER